MGTLVAVLSLSSSLVKGGLSLPTDVTHIGDRVADTLTPAPLLKASEGNSRETVKAEKYGAR